MKQLLTIVLIFATISSCKEKKVDNNRRLPSYLYLVHGTDTIKKNFGNQKGNITVEFPADITMYSDSIYYSKSLDAYIVPYTPDSITIIKDNIIIFDTGIQNNNTGAGTQIINNK